MISSVSPISVSGGSSAEIYSDKTEDNFGLGQDLAFHANANDNIAIGENALNSTDGDAQANVGIGTNALTTVGIGNNNIAIGYNAGKTIEDTSSSIAIGYKALEDNNNTGNLGIGYLAGAEITGAGNMAIGWQAMATHTTGTNNIAIGYDAMSDTDQSADTLSSTDNIFIGKDSGGGTWTTNDSNRNIGIGSVTLAAAMNGALDNVAVGYNSLNGLTEAINNTAVGSGAGNAITTGNHNTAIGKGALASVTTTVANVAVGYASGIVLEGSANTNIGYATAYTGVNLSYTTSLGYLALYTANENDADGTTAIGSHAAYNYAPTGGAGFTGASTIIGYHAGYDISSAGRGLTTGIQNTAVGHESLGANAGAALTGDSNTVVGYRAGYGLTGQYADNNVLIGANSGLAVTSGSSNAFLGKSSGVSITSGVGNTFIGSSTDGEATSHYQTGIGLGAVPQVSYETRIGHYGGFQFYSTEKTLNATSNDDNDVAATTAVFTLPAFAYIKSISVVILTLSGDTTADFCIRRSVDSAGADDEALSDAGANLEILGAGADGTVNTGNLNSGGANDIQCGNGTGNLKQVWYNEKVANLNSANHATETNVSYIWVCNAGTGNEDTQHGTSAKLRICVEYIGQS